MKKIKLFVLHGFLGNIRDFDFLDSFSDCEVIPIDWMSFTWSSLNELGREINRYVEKKTSTESHYNVLLGYSLGGRIALHALKNNPSLFRAAILLSTHPGLDSFEQRKTRLEADKQNAKTFRVLPWKELMKKWNSQPVFAGEENLFIRNENDYDRENLAKILTIGSLGVQEDFKSYLALWSLPLLWLVGEKDKQFREEADKLVLFHPQSKIRVVSGGGHRFPWAQKKESKEQISEFFKSVFLKDLF